MNIRLFNKNYWIRRFGKQREVRGYLTSTHSDFVASLHVHPLGADSVSALPEGLRKIRRLEGHGDVVLVVADEAKNRKGDLLYYNGDWYECVSAQQWNTTMLSHLNYQFVLVPTDASNSIDLEPPAGNPNTRAKGGRA